MEINKRFGVLVIACLMLSACKDTDEVHEKFWTQPLKEMDESVIVRICPDGHRIWHTPSGQYKIFYSDLFFGTISHVVEGPNVC